MFSPNFRGGGNVPPAPVSYAYERNRRHPADLGCMLRYLIVFHPRLYSDCLKWDELTRNGLGLLLLVINGLSLDAPPTSTAHANYALS